MPVPTLARYAGATAALLVILEFFTIAISIAVSEKSQYLEPTPKYLIALLLINGIAASFAFVGAIQLNKLMLIPFFFSMAVLISIHIVVFVVRIWGWSDWLDNIHVSIIAFNILMTYGVGVLYRHIMEAEKVRYLAACLHVQRTYQTI